MPKLPLKKQSPRFAGLRPASAKASRLAAKSSRKRATSCEVKLWGSLGALGLKFKKNVASLPGCPDVVFDREKVAVFVDGDFWHGRRLASRIARLSKGHNSEYWIRKIQSNVERDRRVRRKLRALGWRVIRVWESQINGNADVAAARVATFLRGLPTPRS
jgi:DNA mismatch endonuclease (patch repair protein)